ncbi:GntR family transcriptional regulator [Treponema lecithinolyticum]|uniref:Transcriptional regulator, GntR family n=1 Tax=Treponema lecithinolyticum ATCC 700332 TaxID=1321815 RepID=A0ABN0NYJ3_TRELE|nr:GntR family transcriptional regulator [Treponema lecithinolyticum]ERJ92631.1 transcriptional regulator, GntR family [Treponema lecithinolyticum ATCC 700332]
MHTNDKSVQATVYNILKNSIMRLQLKPGTAMSTQEIADKLHVSKTPVREAFIRLQREGLVEIFPQKQTVVSRIDLKRTAQERFIRESLECAVMEAVIENCSRKNLALLRENIEKQRRAREKKDYLLHILLDNEFHKLLFTIAGQPLCWETIDDISGNYARIRLMTVWTAETMDAVIAQHVQLLAVIERGNVEEAREYMKAHLGMLDTEMDGLLHKYPDFFKQENTENGVDCNMLLSL